MDTAFYEDKYGYLLREGFQKNKSIRRKFFKATQYYDNQQYDDALQLFSALEKKCTDYQEHTAVFLMEGLCYHYKQMWNHEIAAYQAVLEQEPSYSRAWSNLGHVYFTAGKTNLAKEAYTKALACDPSNEYAYANLAVLYLHTGEYEQALDYALHALQQNQRLAAAASAASAAYANLGDRENAMKYCNLYSMCGGDFENAKKMIENILLNQKGKETSN